MNNRLIRIWVVLIVATLASTLVDLEWRSGGLAATAAILVIAAFKIRYVGLDYMELRRAPIALRLAFEGWLAAITLALIGMFAFGPALFAVS